MNDPISLRLPAAVHDALRKAAADDKRPTAALARIIITDWLVAKGYLKEEPQR